MANIHYLVAKCQLIDAKEPMVYSTHIIFDSSSNTDELVQQFTDAQAVTPFPAANVLYAEVDHFEVDVPKHLIASAKANLEYKAKFAELSKADSEGKPDWVNEVKTRYPDTEPVIGGFTVICELVRQLAPADAAEAYMGILKTAKPSHELHTLLAEKVTGLTPIEALPVILKKD